MASYPHTSFPKGKKILIIMKDGTQLTDRYIARHSKHVEFAKIGRIKVTDIRSLTYIRNIEK
jgi:hypothetical protein